MCENSFYKDNKEYSLLYCRYTEKVCPFSKRCDKVKQYIQNENYEYCEVYIANKKDKIPKGAYKINLKKQERNGFLTLYVEKDNICEKVRTTLTEYNKPYIYIKKLKTKTKVSDKPIK